jgi:hypothetical protein
MTLHYIIILVVKNMISPQRSIYKYTCTSPDVKTHSQIDHIMLDRRWHWSVHNIQLFRGAVYDTYRCLVVAKVKERWAVSKQAAQKFDGEGFNLRKLNELEVRK